jgi:hypothetical protein
MTKEVYCVRQSKASLVLLVSTPLNSRLRKVMQRSVADQQGLPSLFGLTSLGKLVSNPLTRLKAYLLRNTSLFTAFCNSDYQQGNSLAKISQKSRLARI